ncbi:hypothetical protein [Mesorhizobium sp. WSM2239]|uniref:Uncharacterized protein n=2 Tax=unclassified Mesorhizobium TaxID=325217 RepID=A0AAU8D307_9HYPH
MIYASRSIVLFQAASILVGVGLGPVFAGDMCGRPGGSPTELFERVTKAEKLPEITRDRLFVAFQDRANSIVWTFTLATHPAHPTAVCRRPVQDGKAIQLQMNVACSAKEQTCRALLREFEALNARMIEDFKRKRQ